MNNIQLGLRTLALVLLVAISTAILVHPELIGGSGPQTAQAIGTIPALAHH